MNNIYILQLCFPYVYVKMTEILKIVTLCGDQGRGARINKPLNGKLQ